MALPTVSMVARLVADPELKMLPSGVAVCNIRLAANERKLNRETNTWEDGESMYMTAVLWREYAENAAESLSRGDQVIVMGKLREKSYTTREGAERKSVELSVEHIGPTLARAVAKPLKPAGAPAGAGGWGASTDEPAW